MNTMKTLGEKLDHLQELSVQDQVTFLLDGKQNMPVSETSEQIIDFFIQCLQDPQEYSRTLELCNSIYYMLMQAPAEKLVLVVDILISWMLRASMNPLETENCCHAIKVVCNISRKISLFKRIHGQILTHVACNLTPDVVGLIPFHVINR
ncbi:hypothetical protein Ciccas_010693 [Cichlidogyrus casuarinus]|uniref:Uncharacterized protein n=1 Tax=Cichlidogyrus casuarinus TaxID=1844966 RepID=A0ABD2PWD1_9PLAT